VIAQAVQETAPVIERDEPAEVYHSRDENGASMLEDFRDNRRYYRARYIDRTHPGKEPTPAMLFGTMVHLLVLEPDRFADMVADPMPDLSGNAPDGKKWNRRKGSDHEAWWQEELDKRAGKIAADQKTLDRVTAAANAIKSHPVVASILDNDAGEVSHYWTDEETGLRCKCRVDWLASNCAMDIKCAVDPSPAGFARRIVQLGYHRKLAHYLDGLQACHGEPVPLVHVAVEPEWPHRVGVYEIDDLRDGVALGRQQRREVLSQLASCLQNDEWSEPWETGVTALRIPNYAWNENDYTFGGSDDSSDR
jgi:hypothetical protein